MRGAHVSRHLSACSAVVLLTLMEDTMAKLKLAKLDFHLKQNVINNGSATQNLKDLFKKREPNITGSFQTEWSEF